MLPPSGKLLSIICFLAFLVLFPSVKCNSTRNFKDGWKGFSMSCMNEDPHNVSVSCHGVRIVRRIVQQLLEKSAKQRSIELFNGVTLVDINDEKSQRSARLMKGPTFKSIFQFLDGKELRIKLPNFLPRNIESAFKDSLPLANQGEIWIFIAIV